MFLVICGLLNALLTWILHFSSLWMLAVIVRARTTVQKFIAVHVALPYCRLMGYAIAWAGLAPAFEKTKVWAKH